MRKHGWQLPYHPLQVCNSPFLFSFTFVCNEFNVLSVILFSFLKVVAVAVFLALGFAFYVFFAPFVGKKIFQYVMIGIYTPLVSSLPIVLLYAMFYLLFCIMV